MRHGNDFREKAEQLDPSDMLEPGVWYRSPLWSDSHCLGEEKEWTNDGIAWCGRSLADAQQIPDTGETNSLGGLWVENRSSRDAHCATCKRMQQEWDEAREYDAKRKAR